VCRRPCRDCRITAPLPCLDPDTCGIDHLCRPCAAAWRCRLWRINHLRHARDYHAACERYPALVRLHTDPKVAAALWAELRRAIGRDARRTVRRMLARELRDAMKAITGG
jgi:hypothetical protein